MSRIARYAWSSRKLLYDRLRKTPSPRWAVMYSPKIAPTTLYVAAMRSPPKKDGSAAGSRALSHVCRDDAPIARSSDSSSGSADCSPLKVLSATGKKQNSTTTLILGPLPKPKIRISRMAMAKIGMVCDTTNSG